jgi:hypothetical protein
MKIQHNAKAFFGPSHLICPDRAAPMRLSAVVPLQSARSTDEVSYCAGVIACAPYFCERG